MSEKPYDTASSSSTTSKDDRARWTQKAIRLWAIETFGEGDVNALIGRASVEFVELINEARTSEQMAEEIADVVIVLSQAIDVLGFDLQDEIDKKMYKNVNRKWIVEGNGVGRHSKASTETA